MPLPEIKGFAAGYVGGAAIIIPFCTILVSLPFDWFASCIPWEDDIEPGVSDDVVGVVLGDGTAAICG